LKPKKLVCVLSVDGSGLHRVINSVWSGLKAVWPKNNRYDSFHRKLWNKSVFPEPEDSREIFPNKVETVPLKTVTTAKQSPGFPYLCGSSVKFFKYVISDLLDSTKG